MTPYRTPSVNDWPVTQHDCPSTLKHDEPITGGYRCRLCDRVKPREVEHAAPQRRIRMTTVVNDVRFGLGVAVLAVAAPIAIGFVQRERAFHAHRSSVDATPVANLASSRAAEDMPFHGDEPLPRVHPGDGTLWLSYDGVANVPSASNWSILVNEGFVAYAPKRGPERQFDGGMSTPCLRGCGAMTVEAMSKAHTADIRERALYGAGEAQRAILQGIECSDACVATGASK